MKKKSANTLCYNKIMKEVYTLKECADILGSSKNTISGRLKKSPLPEGTYYEENGKGANPTKYLYHTGIQWLCGIMGLPFDEFEKRADGLAIKEEEKRLGPDMAALKQSLELGVEEYKSLKTTLESNQRMITMMEKQIEFLHKEIDRRDDDIQEKKETIRRLQHNADEYNKINKQQMEKQMEVMERLTQMLQPQPQPESEPSESYIVSDDMDEEHEEKHGFLAWIKKGRRR